MKLSDTQLVILSTASQRQDRLILPLPKSLKGGAADKVIGSLITKGLVEEVEVRLGEPHWRDEDGRRLAPVLTDAGLTALDGGTEPTVPVSGKNASKAQSAKKAARKPRQRRPTAKTPTKARTGTKQEQVIAMLKRAKGATVDEIARAFGWQWHTVRGIFAGALKKKLGLAVSSERIKGRGRVYRLPA
jgi:hypothetical protein